MIAGKMIKIIKRPPLHFVLEAVVRENEEKFRFCPSEKNMNKLLDDLPPFTYNTIVKYVGNSGKKIQHSPDYMVMKPFESGVNFFIEGYLHNVGAKNHKESKTFYFRALCYRSLRKVNPHIKYRVSQKFVPLLYKSVFQYDWTW